MEVRTRPTVLVVDDTPENIDVLAGVLSEDYNVKAATRGERALRVVRTGPPPDLILLDVMMPGMDGYEVCSRLKSDPATRDIPVIFVTAKIGMDDELRGLGVGAVDYILKPISAPIVKARVGTHLALADQNRQLEHKVRERTDELYRTRLQLIQRLGRAAEYKDNETGMHVIRVGETSRIIASGIGLSESYCETLRHASPMHDIGKIGIPDRVLSKPGRLTAEEWSLMRTHCEIGARIIGSDEQSDLIEMAREVALTHHERWDGRGYPRGLSGENVPLAGRIVALADVFDALTSTRPYKVAWDLDRACDYMRRGAGTHFEPRLVDVFMERLPEIVAVSEANAEESAEPLWPIDMSVDKTPPEAHAGTIGADRCGADAGRSMGRGN